MFNVSTKIVLHPHCARGGFPVTCVCVDDIEAIVMPRYIAHRGRIADADGLNRTEPPRFVHTSALFFLRKSSSLASIAGFLARFIHIISAHCVSSSS